MVYPHTVSRIVIYAKRRIESRFLSSVDCNVRRELMVDAYQATFTDLKVKKLLIYTSYHEQWSPDEYY